MSRRLIEYALGSKLRETPHPCPAAPPIDAQFPVIIFSHGLLGSLEMYTSLCHQLASFGYVVVAPEHEDGSALYAHPLGSPEPILFKSVPPPPDGSSLEAMRSHIQQQREPFLDHRLSEVRSIIKGIQAQDPSLAWGETMDPNKINLIGHSFGAATCIRASLELDVPIVSRVILDLWAAPVPSHSFVECSTPSIFIGSEQFRELPETQHLTKALAAKSVVGANRVICSEHLLCEAEGPLAACEPLYLRDSAHQQCSDTPQFLPGWLGRKFGLTGAGDWEVQQQVLCQTIADFLAPLNCHGEVNHQ